MLASTVMLLFSFYTCKIGRAHGKRSYNCMQIRVSAQVEQTPSWKGEDMMTMERGNGNGEKVTGTIRR